ncbi:MAG: IS982 family transposase [Saprospiraceae bacterium]
MLTKRGKSSTGWFFGFKLHLVINQLGEIVVFKFSSGNTADNHHNLLESIAENMQGFLFGDKGYISKIAASLKQRGLHLITKLRKNMKKKQQLTPEQKYYMKHRGLIETVFDVMKHTLDIEHSCNRSTKNYFVNVIAALIAYTFLEQIPCIPAYKTKVGEKDFQNAQILLID